MQTFSEQHEHISRFPVRLVPLHWQEGRLLAPVPLTEVRKKAARITLLHTNDLHARVDEYPTETGQQRGGMGRIATTIRRTRMDGPTLVFDLGDIVFGGGTWWNIQGIEAVADLRGKAGCDLATIGNHDLEHGIAGLRELVASGYPLTSANLQVEDEQVQRYLSPAYLAEVGGWRVGITGLTTLATYDLIPTRILRGITLLDPLQAARRVVAALEPLVDTIVILSHLGFYPDGPGDIELASHLTGSKVSVILGGHTHAALDPAPVVHSIPLCHAGAYGANIGEVVLNFNKAGKIEVQTRLLPQDETVPADPRWQAVRDQLAQTFQPWHETIFPLPHLPQSSGKQWDRLREWALLTRALRAGRNVSPSAILLVPLLSVAGQLPSGNQVTLAEIMTTYPNSEHLFEINVSGKTLKALLLRQDKLLYYQQARALRFDDESELNAEQVQEEQSYTIITSELVCEGGLGWELFPAVLLSASRNLNMTCSQIVCAYVSAQNVNVEIREQPSSWELAQHS
jgi:5'-nucleotidase